MMDLFDRDFTGKDADILKEAHAPILSTQDQKLFRGLTQETVEMDRRVNIEKKRAEKAEAALSREISRMHRYELQPVSFGGSWGVDSWPDSVTIYDGEDEVTVIAVPPMPPVYDKQDEMSISFFNPRVAMPYWLRFTRNGKNQMIPTGIQKPAFDTHTYTIAISTKKLPWVLT